jgi:hypothetical protein
MLLDCSKEVLAGASIPIFANAHDNNNMRTSLDVPSSRRQADARSTFSKNRGEKWLESQSLTMLEQMVAMRFGDAFPTIALAFELSAMNKKIFLALADLSCILAISCAMEER